jgi:hypothetical protein
MEGIEMNAEQKQHMAHELGQWNAAMKSACSVGNLLAISTRMAALLQELIDAPYQVASVPDSKTLQFLTDVLTAAGLLRHGKKDSGLATRIADESCRIRQQLFTQPEQPADLVRDAERYRWLRNDGAGFDISVAEIDEDGHESWVHGYPPEELDAAIDAAIAAKKGGAE